MLSWVVHEQSFITSGPEQVNSCNVMTSHWCWYGFVSVCAYWEVDQRRSSVILVYTVCSDNFVWIIEINVMNSESFDLENLLIKLFERVLGKESLLHIRTAKFQASLRISAGSPEPVLFAHVRDRPKGNFSQKTRHVAFLRSRACALKDRFEGKSGELFSWDAVHLLINTWISQIRYFIFLPLWLQF